MTTEIGNTSRLFALDIFRGGTVLLMILVNSTVHGEKTHLKCFCTQNGMGLHHVISFSPFLYTLWEYHAIFL